MTNDAFVLQTERLGLMLWSDGDVEAVARLHGDEETTRYLSIRRPWTREDAESHIARWMNDWHRHGIAKLKLVRGEDGQMAGRAGFGFMEERSAFELSYTIDRTMRGLGYATEISTGLARWFFAHRQENHFLGLADVRNTASQRVLQKIGMKFERTGPYDGATFHFYRMDRP